MVESNRNKRLLAFITGTFSIAIAILYLVLVTILDSRGAMLPPPIEALGVVVVAFADSF